MATTDDGEWILDLHDEIQYWETTKAIRTWIANEPRRIAEAEERADERAAAIIRSQQECAKAVTMAVREALAGVAEALHHLEVAS
jgi:hypothetical protein